MRPRGSPCSRPARARRRRAAGLCALGSCLGLLAWSSPAHAKWPFHDPRWADRWEHLDPRPRNQFVIEANTLGNSSGVDLGYRRAFGRHVTLGALLEWAYPNPGYWLLQGFAHTLETAVWIKRPWTGVYFAANVTVGHQFLITLPELRTIAVGAGAAIGWSWDLTEHINVGF